jgi:hypothetical protein
MRAITLFRAFAWLGVAIVFWSLNMQWGSSTEVGSGPPLPWHRTVVGAGLLAFIAAVTLSVSGRGGNPPGWVARAVAALCAALVLLLAWRLYGRAEGMFADAIEGAGWTWMMAGGGLVAGGVIGSFGLKPSDADNKPRARRKRR